MNIFMSVEKVKIGLYERQVGKGVTKEVSYSEIKVENMSVITKIDRKGKTSVSMGIREFLVSSTYPEAGLIKPYKTILGNPEIPDDIEYAQDEEVKEEDKLKKGYMRSCLKESLLAVKLFDQIEQHAKWVSGLDVKQELSISLKVDGTNVIAEGELRELRIIVTIPTMERLQRYSELILPHFPVLEQRTYE
jgi:hypothetical protein